MNSQEVYDYFQTLKTKMQSIQSLLDLNNLIDTEGLKGQIENFYTKYPQYEMRVSAEEIQRLKEVSVLCSENKLNPETFNGNPLERLLVATLWKNGDINKIQHIVDGILHTDGFRTVNSLIFKQFGRSLAEPLEPIVDQHVLRAFGLMRLTSFSANAVKTLQKKSIYKSSDQGILNEYRDWFKQRLAGVSADDRVKFKESLDKILFIKGKEAKDTGVIPKA